MPLRWPELVLILVVVVVIFAAGKLPEISGGLRRTLDNLRARPSSYQIDLQRPSDAAAELNDDIAKSEDDSSDRIEQIENE